MRIQRQCAFRSQPVLFSLRLQGIEKKICVITKATKSCRVSNKLQERRQGGFIKYVEKRKQQINEQHFVRTKFSNQLDFFYVKYLQNWEENE